MLATASGADTSDWFPAIGQGLSMTLSQGRQRMLVALVALGSLALTVGNTDVRALRMGLSSDDESTMRNLQRLVPLGTPVAEAERIMRSYAFSCEILNHSSFIEHRRWGTLDATECVHNDLNYLSCYRRRHHLLGWKGWHIAFVFGPKGVVTNVLVAFDSESYFAI